MITVKPAQRRKARKLTLQALYEWHMSERALAEIEADFLIEHQDIKFDVPYFKFLLHSIPAQLGELDSAMREHLDRDIKALAPVELTILRIALYELKHCPDVPQRVVLNEAIELAKVFGGEDGYKYINAVLDKAIKHGI